MRDSSENWFASSSQKAGTKYVARNEGYVGTEVPKGYRCEEGAQRYPNTGITTERGFGRHDTLES